MAATATKPLPLMLLVIDPLLLLLMLKTIAELSPTAPVPKLLAALPALPTCSVPPLIVVPPLYVFGTGEREHARPEHGQPARTVTVTPPLSFSEPDVGRTGSVDEAYRGADIVTVGIDDRPAAANVGGGGLAGLDGDKR